MAVQQLQIDYAEQAQLALNLFNLSDNLWKNADVNSRYPSYHPRLIKNTNDANEVANALYVWMRPYRSILDLAELDEDESFDLIAQLKRVYSYLNTPNEQFATLLLADLSMRNRNYLIGLTHFIEYTKFDINAFNMINRIISDYDTERARILLEALF